MFKNMTRRAAGGTAALTLLVAIPLGSWTPAAAVGDFGQHVRMCAQDVGFNGEHNPGMHQGFHDWDPTHIC